MLVACTAYSLISIKLTTSQAALAAALEAAAKQPEGQESTSLASAALAERISRFEQQTKIRVDAAEYQAWLTANNARQPPLVPEQIVLAESQAVTDPAERRFAQLLVELGEPLCGQSAQLPEESQAGQSETSRASEVVTEADAAVPSWQSSAPKAELYVPRNADSANGSRSEEQYPAKFMEIIEFIQTGKPIEGIRKIPDTVVEDPSISTTGKMQAPLKPWERRAAAAESS